MSYSLGEPIPGQEVASAMTEFHTVYGAAMESWAKLEGCMFYWFMSCVQMDEKMGRAIFFSAKNFNGRRDMLNAAIPFSPFDEPTRDFVRGASSKCRTYSVSRNAIAHGEPVLDLGRKPVEMVLTEGRSLSDGAQTSLSDLKTFTRNVSELRRLMYDMHPFYRNALSPLPDAKEYLELVKRLPNQAYSSEPTPIRADKQRPPQDGEG